MRQIHRVAQGRKEVGYWAGYGAEAGNEAWFYPKEERRFDKNRFTAVGLEAAWINDLQGGGLESGVFRASPGSPLVEWLWAWLPEEGLLTWGA